MKLDDIQLYQLFENWANGNRADTAAQLNTPLKVAQFCNLLHGICRKETLPYHYQGLVNLLDLDTIDPTKRQTLPAIKET